MSRETTSTYADIVRCGITDESGKKVKGKIERVHSK
jgi:hypothetical protein